MKTITKQALNWHNGNSGKRELKIKVRENVCYLGTDEGMLNGNNNK